MPERLQYSAAILKTATVLFSLGVLINGLGTSVNVGSCLNSDTGDTKAVSLIDQLHLVLLFMSTLVAVHTTRLFNSFMAKLPPTGLLCVPWAAAAHNLRSQTVRAAGIIAHFGAVICGALLLTKDTPDGCGTLSYDVMLGVVALFLLTAFELISAFSYYRARGAGEGDYADESREYKGKDTHDEPHIGHWLGVLVVNLGIIALFFASGVVTFSAVASTRHSVEGKCFTGTGTEVAGKLKETACFANAATNGFGRSSTGCVYMKDGVGSIIGNGTEDARLRETAWMGVFSMHVTILLLSFIAAPRYLNPLDMANSFNTDIQFASFGHRLTTFFVITYTSLTLLLGHMAMEDETRVDCDDHSTKFQDSAHVTAMYSLAGTLLGTYLIWLVLGYSTELRIEVVLNEDLKDQRALGLHGKGGFSAMPLGSNGLTGKRKPTGSLTFV